MLSNYSLKINDKDRRSDELAKPIFDALDGGWSRDWISIHPLLSLLLLTYSYIQYVLVCMYTTNYS